MTDVEVTAYCSQCDRGGHTCPGCGAYLNHGGPGACSGCLLEVSRQGLRDARADSDRLRTALERMANPPIVLPSDDPSKVAAWFVNVAREAVEKPVHPIPEQGEQ